MFISTLLVKYFAHCNQALVKFVVISSWPDPYDKKNWFKPDVFVIRCLCYANNLSTLDPVGKVQFSE